MSHVFCCPCNNNPYAICECAAIDQREHTAALNRQADELRAAREAEPVRFTVKPLVWTRMGDEWWGYVDGFGIQRATIGGRIDIGFTVHLICGPSNRIRYATLADAQAVAQEEWSAFILASIQP